MSEENERSYGSVSVVIPTFRPDRREFERVLKSLETQTKKPDEIILIHTESAGEDTSSFRSRKGVRFISIPQKEFDHGGTRNLGWRQAAGEFVVFMTQDAIPADENLIERLIRPFEDPDVAVTYARQIPRTGCRLAERYSRMFNYPADSRKKTSADLKELGIKTYFCSDVCAAYRKDYLRILGGFPEPVIFNEDMITAARIIRSGKAVYYAADAVVRHSHNYSGIRQFKRNFDLGVSQADYPEIFEDVPSEGEGIRMVKKTAAFLIEKKRPHLIIPLIWQSGCKYLGYRFGKHYRKLPKRLVEAFTMNRPYWDKIKSPEDFQL